MPNFDADAIRRDNTIDAVASRMGVRLQKDGKEWRGCCCFHQEATPSFTIFSGKSGVQRFHCFGCGAGGDVIDFVREHQGVGFAEACEILGGKREPTPRVSPEPIPSPLQASFITPPSGAPIPTDVWNPKRGRITRIKPTTLYAYPGVGYVARIDLGDRRKWTPAILWDAERGWSFGSMPAPRPLYGLQGLQERPNAQVLVVEGEKCRDAAAAVLTGLVVISWCGGGKAAAKTDWSPLAGRRVVIWPDNDASGLTTAEGVAELCSAAEVKLVGLDGLDKPKGWDVADAIADDWMGRDDLVQFMRSRVRPYVAKERIPAPAGHPRPERPNHSPAQEDRPLAGAIAQRKPRTSASPPRNDSTGKPAPRVLDNVTFLPGASLPPVEDDDLDGWQARLLNNEHGVLQKKLANNWYWMLRGHPDVRHVFAFNDISQGVFLMRRPPWETDTDAPFRPRSLKESDIYQAAIWLENKSLTLKKSDARDAIKSVADHRHFNPIKEYLQGLQWDGVPRLAGGMYEGAAMPHAAEEYLGAPPDAIFGTFLTKWHVSAVARIMRPGCKADCMLIVEGQQGRMKSTYLRAMATINGHEYFADGIGDITNKDSIMLMAGCWIIENAELAGFSRPELSHIKAWLSRTTDRYIPKFESEPREIPRSFVVSGTHNPSGHGYLKDPTGNRRFWPLPVVQVDIDRVRRDRDQLWAEAMALYQAGHEWWLTPEEEAACDLLTEERRAVDPWSYKIEEAVGMGKSVTLKEVLEKLAIPAAQQNELTVKRIGDYLRGEKFRPDGPDRFVREG